MNFWRGSNFFWRRTLNLLLLGQLVSFLIALTSFSSSLIANLGVDAPVTQSSFTYLGLALIYGSIMHHKHQKPTVSWYWYLLLSFLDVQCVYFYNKAYQYTSITSVTILDCFTIAWIIILTWVLLGTRYSPSQLSGAAICVVGLCFVLLSDFGVAGAKGGGSRPILGDAIVIAGTIFDSLSSVGEEFVVKNKNRLEMMAMIGAYGFLVSIIQISVLELKSLGSVKWSANIVLAFIGYTITSFVVYSLFTRMLQLSGATMYNLSILTSDVWVVVIRIFFYHQKVDWLYFLAFGIVVLGLILYSTSEKEIIPDMEDIDPKTKHVSLDHDEETTPIQRIDNQVCYI